MAITAKQERYARLVASGMDLHTAALEAGCKNHEAARKFVADMAKRENVQAFIHQVRTVNTELTTPTENSATATTDIGYQNASAIPTETDQVRQAPTTPQSPLEFLTSVFNNVDGLYTPKERINAAIALLPYTEQKLAQTGKKEDAIDVARQKSENSPYATLSRQMEMQYSGLKN
ncbi:hypothetical protein [Moraxella equi]|uniref:Terminase small subunit n=1 Tax=Moraxella equi TaxID=60442 RepID=A0A378QQH1_9GAMM|nr:hypothetical protein [Moraxella equi]OPH38210.1 hypothetical protein B5J93_06595 [Moraxella equi]STZ03125.1 Uncharacterised protein [Moraxella equi]